MRRCIATYRLVYLTVLLELRPQSLVVGVPRQAAVAMSVLTMTHEIQRLCNVPDEKLCHNVVTSCGKDRVMAIKIFSRMGLLVGGIGVCVW